MATWKQATMLFKLFILYFNSKTWYFHNFDTVNTMNSWQANIFKEKMGKVGEF